MLSRAFEWYRIVSAQPTSETIDKRAAAATDLVKAMDEAKDWDLLLGSAAGVVSGFDGFRQDSPIVQRIIQAIREHESAFPQDLSENALALRACAAIALGEILGRNPEKARDANAILVAALLRCGLGVRPLPKPKYLKQLIEELTQATTRVFASAGLARRARLPALAQRLEKLAEPSDLPTAWKALVPALRAAMRDINQQSEIDREELNILWWMFGGLSTITGKLVAEMPFGAAALCCGVELANQCLTPPTSGHEAMVRRAFEGSRKSQELSERPLEKIASDWDEQIMGTLVPSNGAREVIQQYPVLFPASWLCNRLIASQGAKGWPSEFKQMTGVVADHSCAPSTWAIQVFRERIAQRIYNESSNS